MQCDGQEKRRTHPVLGEMNGVTRFYGPYTDWLSGAYMDIGNAYLQRSTLDIDPEPGRFGAISFLHVPHKAMPYEVRLIA